MHNNIKQVELRISSTKDTEKSWYRVKYKNKLDMIY